MNSYTYSTALFISGILGLMDHEHYMKMALDLAGKGAGYTSPNPMVGAVVVKEGKVVGKGWHQNAGGPHAEVNAIDDAGKNARGADIYVTLEPCNHHGRTPPCTQKILDAGIVHVIMAMDDPNPDVKGRGADYLMEKGVKVTRGVCEGEAVRLNERFVKYVKTKRPFVVLKCACTLDGQIATRSGDSKWVTGPESRQYVHRIRHEVDAILVGIGTVMADNPSLTTRLDGVACLDPARVILDTRLSINPDAKVLTQTSDALTYVMTGAGVDPEKKAAIEKTGARVVPVREKNHGIDLDALMEKLGALGITSVLIEGGGKVVASALKTGIVDKVNFFYAPKILGGNDGVSVCSGTGPLFMKDSIILTRISVRRFGDDVMIQGYIKPDPIN